MKLLLMKEKNLTKLNISKRLKKVLSFSAISDEEFALISGMDGYNENDLIRIEDKVKTHRM